MQSDNNTRSLLPQARARLVESPGNTQQSKRRAVEPVSTGSPGIRDHTHETAAPQLPIVSGSKQEAERGGTISGLSEDRFKAKLNRKPADTALINFFRIYDTIINEQEIWRAYDFDTHAIDLKQDVVCTAVRKAYTLVNGAGREGPPDSVLRSAQSAKRAGTAPRCSEAHPFLKWKVSSRSATTTNELIVFDRLEDRFKAMLKRKTQTDPRRLGASPTFEKAVQRIREYFIKKGFNLPPIILTSDGAFAPAADQPGYTPRPRRSGGT